MQANRMTVVIGIAAMAGVKLIAPTLSLASAEQPRLVFMSPRPAEAAFVGGITGADLVCRESAEAKELEGIFLAFLGDGSFGPVNRFATGHRPVVNIRGDRVALSWRDLAAGKQEAAVLQLDGTAGAAKPWTNVESDGSSGMLATTCNRWWNAGDRHAGGVGISTREVASCDSLRPFVCLQE